MAKPTLRPLPPKVHPAPKDPGKTVKIKNFTKGVINSGQVKILPAGTPGDVIQIAEGNIPEGLKRLLSAPNSGVKIVQ